MKRGNHAIIKQTPHGRGIILYGCASRFKEGYKYDILVEAIKSYQGLKEITVAYPLVQKAEVALGKYRINNLHQKKQNEVIENIMGIYQHRRLLWQGQSIPLYFKNKRHTPPEGSKLKIHYALRLQR